MAKGGTRPGAGRPKGSTRKPRLSDDLTDKQKKAIVTKAYKQAMNGDSRLLSLFIEQMYGKAQQAIDHTTDGEPLRILFDKTFKGRATTQKTTGDSKEQ